MRFKVVLFRNFGTAIPVNYQYPLSSAIYRIISKGSAEYAAFLHQTGYGSKGIKLFTFSQLNAAFKIEGDRKDRMRLIGNEVNFEVAFHLPVAMESFVKGLFQSEQIDIADKQSKVSFAIKSVESLANPLQSYKNNEMLNLQLKPLSPIVAGLPNEKGNYDFLPPDDARFTESLIYNWRSKIATCYDEATAVAALLMIEVIPMKFPFKSRLITIKSGTEQETKIKGFFNYGLKVTAEKRFVELLLNAGAGIYNSMGCGCCQIEGMRD